MDLAPSPFIVGVGRSGTTLLRLMIDAHPEIAIPGETHFLPDLLELGRQASPADALRVITSSSTWPNMAIEERALRNAIERCAPFSVPEAMRAFYRTYAGRFGKSRWGDKTPTYRSHMVRIQSVLPEAHFIHIIRDGRDAALSYRGLWFGPGDGIEAQARFWVEQVLLARQQSHELKHYMEIKFENLVREPEQTLGTVCEFLSLGYDCRMLDYHISAAARLAEYRVPFGPAGTPADMAQFIAIHDHTRQRPDPARIERWRTEMPKQQWERYEAIAGDLLRSLGYACSP